MNTAKKVRFFFLWGQDGTTSTTEVGKPPWGQWKGDNQSLLATDELVEGIDEQKEGTDQSVEPIYGEIWK